MPSRRDRVPSGPVTAQRCARLYGLLALLRGGPKTRAALIRTLRLDLRGFYRDLKKLRELGVHIASQGHHYVLTQGFERAISRLPFPDPGLNLHEAIQLAAGPSPAHRKLRRQIRKIIGRRP